MFTLLLLASVLSDRYCSCLCFIDEETQEKEMKSLDQGRNSQ